MNPLYINEPIDAFFDFFAEECYLLDTADTNIIYVIYDDIYKSAEQYNVAVSGTVASIKVKNNDINLYSLRKKTNVRIRGVDMFVREVQYNGNGVSVLELEKITT